jgi:hypothetical protein
VPNDLDTAPGGSLKRTDRLAFAVRSGKLHHGNAGRASRHSNSVGGTGRRWGPFRPRISQARHDLAGIAKVPWAATNGRPIVVRR